MVFKMKFIGKLRSNRYFLVVTASVLCIILLCGCGSAETNDSYASNKGFDYFATTDAVAEEIVYDGFYDADYEMKAEAEYEYSGSATGGSAPESQAPTSSSDNESTSEYQRKIIRNAHLSLETRTFDESIASISATVEKYGGYVESSYVSGQSVNSSGVQRRAEYTVRVPAESLDAYLDSLGGNFNVLSRQISSNDITTTYYDAKARLESLEIQEERLLAMLEKATELEYLIQLENALADVRYQIERYYSQIRVYDNQVSYSTVSMNISEVVEYQKVVENPKTFGQRFMTAAENSWNNFVDDLEDFAIEFIYALPGLIIWILIIVIIVLVIKLMIARHKKKAAAKYQAQLAAYNAAMQQSQAQNTETETKTENENK